MGFFVSTTLIGRKQTLNEFNLDLRVDKAMNQLSESKALRRWTYVVGCFVIMGLVTWQLAPILQALAKLIEVLK